MTNTQAALRTVMVAAALLLLVTTTSDRVAQADSLSQSGILRASTWYLSLPSSGLKAIYTFDADRTVVGVVSTLHGGPPSPPRPGLRSTDHGIWRPVTNGYEATVLTFLYDPDSGDVMQITQIRVVFSLDSGSNRGSGEFFVALWACDTPTTCPDPNVDPPSVEEFAPQETPSP